MVIRRGVLLEREGVLVHRPNAKGVAFCEDCKFMPRSLEALSLFSENNIAVRIVSHQPCVGSGQRTLHELGKQTRRLLLEIALHGADVEKVYYCTHSYPRDCLCRKPLPGMLLKAMLDGFWRPPDTYMIGDSEADMEAASRAGCRGILLRRDALLGAEVRWRNSTEVASSLYEAAERIVLENVTRFAQTAARTGIPTSIPCLWQTPDFTDLEKEPA